MGRLSGKSAMVTGATGGIGEAIATRFLQEGASVMLMGKLPPTFAEIRPGRPVVLAITSKVCREGRATPNSGGNVVRTTESGDGKNGPDRNTCR